MVPLVYRDDVETQVTNDNSSRDIFLICWVFIGLAFNTIYLVYQRIEKRQARRSNTENMDIAEPSGVEISNARGAINRDEGIELV